MGGGISSRPDQVLKTSLSPEVPLSSPKIRSRDNSDMLNLSESIQDQILTESKALCIKDYNANITESNSLGDSLSHDTLDAGYSIETENIRKTGDIVDNSHSTICDYYDISQTLDEINENYGGAINDTNKSSDFHKSANPENTYDKANCAKVLPSMKTRDFMTLEDESFDEVSRKAISKRRNSHGQAFLSSIVKASNILTEIRAKSVPRRGVLSPNLDYDKSGSVDNRTKTPLRCSSLSPKMTRCCFLREENFPACLKASPLRHRSLRVGNVIQSSCVNNKPSESFKLEDTSSNSDISDTSSEYSSVVSAFSDRLTMIGPSINNSERHLSSIENTSIPSASESYNVHDSSIQTSLSDLDQVREVTRKLNLSTRSPSLSVWRETYIEKSPVETASLVGKFEEGEMCSSTNEDIQDGSNSKELSKALRKLKFDLISMRAQDQSLAKRLILLRQEIHSLKLQRSYQEHKEILDYAADGLEEKRDFASEHYDFVPEQFHPVLKELGVTKMNISRRQFSVI